MENQENTVMNQSISCSNCGGKNDINANFCVYCGSSLDIERKQTSDAMTSNISNEQTYDFTGQGVAEGQQNFEQILKTTESKESPKKFGILVIFGFILLFSILSSFSFIGIGIFVLLVYFYIKNENFQRVFGVLLRVFGGIFLFGIVMILILFGMCFAAI